MPLGPMGPQSPPFAIATRDQVRANGTLVENRLTTGVARITGHTIEARDDHDAELVAAADALARVDLRGVHDRVRIVATARRIGDVRVDDVTLTVTRGARSIVTTPEQLHADLRHLDAGDANAGAASRTMPILWKNGSAAVLLHEAAGHAAEHQHAPLAWPAWLTVHDEPRAAVDDCGEPTRVTDLLREAPASYRRESFRDVPLRRMSNLVARQHGAPFELPPQRIEIELLTGGVYEPLTETVSLFVSAATLVDGDATQPLAPFVITETRAAIVGALRGATGEPLRYPGVVCSSEGQEVVVGSHAPLVLTVFA
ncbi:MAG TPA: hypothetical protein VF618_25130 [Thermoanaerobaculia bacterium]